MKKKTYKIECTWLTLRPIFSSYWINFIYDQEGNLQDAALEIRRGFINRKYDNIELGYIRDVSATQNILQKLFNFGMVEVYAKDESSKENETGTQLLMDVKSPIQLKGFIKGLSKEVKDALGVRRLETTY